MAQLFSLLAIFCGCQHDSEMEKLYFIFFGHFSKSKTLTLFVRLSVQPTQQRKELSSPCFHQSIRNLNCSIKLEAVSVSPSSMFSNKDRQKLAHCIYHLEINWIECWCKKTKCSQEKCPENYSIFHKAVVLVFNLSERAEPSLSTRKINAKFDLIFRFYDTKIYDFLLKRKCFL